jgi:hypothetical protein
VRHDERHDDFAEHALGANGVLHDASSGPGADDFGEPSALTASSDGFDDERLYDVHRCCGFLAAKNAGPVVNDEPYEYWSESFLSGCGA